MKLPLAAVFACALHAQVVVAQQRRPLTPSVERFVSVDAPAVALRGVSLIDGTGTPVRRNQTVLVRGTRIEAVGDASMAIPPNATVVDLPGHTVIPGLVGLHEHMYFGGVRQPISMTSGAALYFAMGVTTAMTAGARFPYDELNLKRTIDGGALPGPRMRVSGPYLRGGPPTPGTQFAIATREDARRVIAYWSEEGATWFKFMGQGTRALLGDVIDEAHAHGARVTGHLCSISFTEAAALGIDALQHGFITNSDYVPDRVPDVCSPQNMRVQADVDVTSDAVQRTIREIARSGAAVVSTLGVYETFVPERAFLERRALEMLAPDTRAEVEANHAALVEGGLVVPVRLLEKMMHWERDFVAAGGLLGAGSDPWGTGYLPGFGNLRNYEMLVEAGFTAEEAVQVLTLNGARILDEEESLGSVEAGKLADLVVIRGDPVGSPSEIYEVVTVFKDGRGFDAPLLREALKGGIGS